MASPAYNYIRNQYLLGKFSEDDMVKLVELGRITDEERQNIISME